MNDDSAKRVCMMCGTEYHDSDIAAFTLHFRGGCALKVIKDLRAQLAAAQQANTALTARVETLEAALKDLRLDGVTDLGWEGVNRQNILIAAALSSGAGNKERP